jgi:electron transport complex protein RnfG
MNKKESRLIPAIVLGGITGVISLLLVVSSSLIPDTSGTLSEKLRSICVSLMGEGEYRLLNDDWEAEGMKISKPDNVNKLILNSDDEKTIAFEITASGYKPPDGITVLVAMNPDGSVKGVAPVTIKDDPGIGTRIENPAFLNSFAGAFGKVDLVKSESNSDNKVMAVTGATYSSRGVVDAVNIAIETYGKLYQ